MHIVELILIAVGLSMDAFAVALCKGLSTRRMNTGYPFVIALFFGGFQALMPFIGWLLGIQFEQYITGVDHWISFVLLALIGGKMIHEAMKIEEVSLEEIHSEKPLRTDYRELFVLAVATSIDALAVGITFAFLRVSIGKAVLLIGTITFLLSIAGVAIGNRFGVKYKNKAEFGGGVVLVLIGLKILIEHLGLL